MIVMRLKGGLGNQLFQYALGRHLSISKNVPLQLDTSSYKVDTLREYRLFPFHIQAHAIDKLPFFATDGKARHLNRLIQSIRGLFSRPFQIVREPSFSFDSTVFDCSDQAYLDGFWQSEKYFLPIAKTLREDLQLKSPIDDELKAVADQIRSTNAVSIHVRRGDYVSNPTTTAFHGVCGVEWYQKALEEIENKVDDPTYFVFSDDYEWAKANLNFKSNMVFVPPSPDGKEAQDMYVMSLCQHNIIANSSFSWWAAWLNANPQKIVIGPEKWFASGPQKTDDLIPAQWIRI
jgi:Glycosyl transferase family 11